MTDAKTTTATDAKTASDFKTAAELKKVFIDRSVKENGTSLCLLDVSGSMNRSMAAVKRDLRNLVSFGVSFKVFGYGFNQPSRHELKDPAMLTLMSKYRHCSFDPMAVGMSTALAYESLAYATRIDSFDIIFGEMKISDVPDILIFYSDGAFSNSMIDETPLRGPDAFMYILGKHADKFARVSKIILIFAVHTDEHDMKSVTGTVSRFIRAQKDRSIKFDTYLSMPGAGFRRDIRKMMDIKIYENKHPLMYNCGNWFYVNQSASYMDVARWAKDNQTDFAQVLFEVSNAIKQDPVVLIQDGVNFYALIHKARSAMFRFKMSPELETAIAKYNDTMSLIKKLASGKEREALQEMIDMARDGTYDYVQYLRRVETTAVKWLKFADEKSPIFSDMGKLIDNLETTKHEPDKFHKLVYNIMSSPKFVNMLDRLFDKTCVVLNSPEYSRFAVPMPAEGDIEGIKSFFRCMLYPLTTRIMSNNAVLAFILYCLYDKESQDLILNTGFERDLILNTGSERSTAADVKHHSLDETTTASDSKAQSMRDILQGYVTILKNCGFLKELIGSVFENTSSFSGAIGYRPYCNLLIVAAIRDPELFTEKQQQDLKKIYQFFTHCVRIKSLGKMITLENLSRPLVYAGQLYAVNYRSWLDSGIIEPEKAIPAIVTPVHDSNGFAHVECHYLDRVCLDSDMLEKAVDEKWRKDQLETDCHHIAVRFLSPLTSEPVDYKTRLHIHKILRKMRQEYDLNSNAQREINDAIIGHELRKLGVADEKMHMNYTTKTFSAIELTEFLGLHKTRNVYGNLVMEYLRTGRAPISQVVELKDLKIDISEGMFRPHGTNSRFHFDEKTVGVIRRTIYGGEGKLVNCLICASQCASELLYTCETCSAPMCNKCASIYYHSQKYKRGTEFDADGHKCPFCRQFRKDQLLFLSKVAADSKSDLPVSGERYKRCTECPRWLCLTPEDKVESGGDGCTTIIYTDDPYKSKWCRTCLAKRYIRIECKACGVEMLEVKGENKIPCCNKCRTELSMLLKIRCPSPDCKNVMLHGGGCNMMICCTGMTYHDHDSIDVKECKFYDPHGSNCCHTEIHISPQFFLRRDNGSMSGYVYDDNINVWLDQTGWSAKMLRAYAVMRSNK